MSMPSWHLPAVRLDLIYSFRARLRLWVLILVPLLLLGGPVSLPAVLLAALDLAVFRWRLPLGSVCFDGCRWWLRVRGRPDQLLVMPGHAYTGGYCLAVALVGDTARLQLLLFRGQVDRECWRRLLLALRYGVSTVSSADAARSG